MNLVDKIMLNSRRVWDEDGAEHVILRCTHHGEVRTALKPNAARCAECWAITLLSQQCLLDDTKEGTASLQQFDETAHKINEVARRGEWDYHPTKSVVRFNPETPDRGVIQLTDF